MENLDQKQPETSVSSVFSQFTNQSGDGDDELLRIASQYALQIRPDQINCLCRLRAFGIDYVKYNPDLEIKIEKFVKPYLEIKHFHQSSGFIEKIIESLSVKRMFNDQSGKINVMR